LELSLSNQRRYSIRKANYILKKVSTKQKSSQKSSPKSVNEFNSSTQKSSSGKSSYNSSTQKSSGKSSSKSVNELNSLTNDENYLKENSKRLEYQFEALTSKYVSVPTSDNQEDGTLFTHRYIENILDEHYSSDENAYAQQIVNYKNNEKPKAKKHSLSSNSANNHQNNNNKKKKKKIIYIFFFFF